MSVETNSVSNPFNNIIQLEEITHFQKPHLPIKSILSNPKDKYRSRRLEDDGWNKARHHKKVSYSPSPTLPSQDGPTTFFGDGDNSEAKVFNELSESNNDHDEDDDNYNQYFKNNPDTSSSKYFSFYDKNGGISDSGEESESDTEFRRDFTKLPTTGREPSSGSGSPSSNRDFSGSGGGSREFFENFISDENLFPFPNQSLDVTKCDMLFAWVVFVIHLGEIVTDFTLAVWHYQNGQKWGCAFTSMFIAFGGITMLHQFGLIPPDQLDRIFRKGKRARILVNCFPPFTNIFIFWEGAITAGKSLADPMQSQQYFKISELSRNLSRVQSFFQAAPLTAVQLVILLENLHETSLSKVWFTLVNIIISLAVMTNANLPSKTDGLDDNPSKAAYLPLTRIFVGTRMFSSLGSRCMAISFLLVGCRCMLERVGLAVQDFDPSSSNSTLEILTSSAEPAVSSTLLGISLLILPRLMFTITDYFSMKRFTQRNLEHYRDQPELGVSSSHPIAMAPLMSIFVGYLATIFFPVGDPLWLFWYLWCEAAIFIIFGNVASLNQYGCLDHYVNWVYTTLFIVTFIIVPFLIPAAKAAVHRRKMENVRRILQVQVVQDSHEQSPSDLVISSDNTSESSRNANGDSTTGSRDKITC